jgi:hypothetical protein
MKSIEARFEQVRERNPNYSAYLCFAHAVKGQQFSRKTLASWFNKLVPESEYGDGERKDTVDFLMTLNNEPRKEDLKGKTMFGTVVLKLRGEMLSIIPGKPKKADSRVVADGLLGLGNSISIAAGIYKK